jgi:flagellar motor switch protein FliG
MNSSVASDQPRLLNGTEKVAAILLSVDKDVAQRLLKHFDQLELSRIARIAATLGSVPTMLIESLTEELVGQLRGNGADLMGTIGQAEGLLTGVVPPEQVAEIMSELLGKSNGHFWVRLSSMQESALAAYLANEHPQTIAAVASKVEPAQAAKFLALLPANIRNEVMRRMLTSGPISDGALRILEATLQEDLVGAATSASSPVASAKVAAIVNQMDRDQIDDILQSVSETDPTIADELKGFLFTFEDIPKLSPRARSILMDQVPTDRLILALRGADNALRDAVLPSLSTRMRRMVEAELSSGEPPPRREIIKAQRAISETVLKLAESGLIEIGAAADGGDF